MTTTDINISIEIIKKQKLRKKSVRKAQERLSVEVLDSTVPLNAFTMKKESIYKLILGFLHFQVGRVRSFALEHSFSVLMGASANDRTIFAIDHKRFRICLIL
jgi:hypothetical protein